jgi:hypothetical protein
MSFEPGDPRALRGELIQAAAVIVAMIEDLDYGQAHADRRPSGSSHLAQVDHVLDAIESERYAQDEKWGPQHHTPAEWFAILMEEIGEAADEVDLTPPLHAEDLPIGNLAAETIVVWCRRIGGLAKEKLDRFIFPKVAS